MHTRAAGRRPQAFAVAVAVMTALGMTGASGAWVPARAAGPAPDQAAVADVLGGAGPTLGAGPALGGGDVAVPYHDGGTFDFDGGWRFALANPDGITDPTGAYAQAASPTYDDSQWRPVHVPHDWSIELNPTADAPTTSGTGFYQGGLGWYRKTFTLPAGMTGKDLSIEFDGVYMDSTVYLNGVPLGGHHYGYTGFSLPLTGAHTDGHTPDVIAVQVRNDVPSSRWYSGSGIYRNVRLVATDPVHVARLGSTVTTPDLEHTSAAGYGTAHVATRIDPTASGAPQEVRVVQTVRDSAGATVGTTASTVTAGAAPVTAQADVRVPSPQLWDTDAPALYSVTTQLQVAGRVSDTYVSRFGFRWTRFDPQAGFFLNGRALKLKGVNLHHTEGALGAAVNRDELLRQLTTMKSMGVNSLRTSHNPPAPELVQLCDQLGIVMMVEAFDAWNVAKVPNDYARFFDADSDADIAEMVRESQNAPSVIMWSIGNEIPNSWEDSALPIARRLIDDVRALDTTRPVVIGSDKYRSVPEPGSALDVMATMLDGVGLNYNSATSVDELHARYPGTFLFESESSSETSTRGEYDQPGQLNTGEDHTPGHRAASSFDNNLESWTMSGEYSLKKDRDRPWFLGQFLWSGIDYIGEPTPYDVFPVKTSFFGAVDTALFPKDQYYLFQSQWTSAPMVHVLPTDWTHHRVGDRVQVWAYANAPDVELFLNGRSLGVRSFDAKTTAAGTPYLETTGPTGDDATVTTGAYPGSYTGTEGTAGRLHLTWTVPFAPGQLVAVARSGGKDVARDELDTAGAPATVRLHPDRTEVRADGTSVVHVEADVVDRRGVLVPDAGDLLRFAVTGGRLLGVDSGRQESQESYKANHRAAFHGKAMAIVTPTGGSDLRVTVSGHGLTPATATVAVQPLAPGASAPQGRAPVSWTTPGAPLRPVALPVPGVGGLTAGTSFSGAEQSQPAQLVDGVTDAGGWSNAYTQSATALLPQVSAARAGDWVSLTAPTARTWSALTAYFVVDETHALPSYVQVQSWDGSAWQDVPGLQITWGTSAGAPTRFTFSPVTTSRLRLVMRSRAPATPGGSFQIRELTPGQS